MSNVLKKQGKKQAVSMQSLGTSKATSVHTLFVSYNNLADYENFLNILRPKSTLCADQTWDLWLALNSMEEIRAHTKLILPRLRFPVREHNGRLINRL